MLIICLSLVKMQQPSSGQAFLSQGKKYIYMCVCVCVCLYIYIHMCVCVSMRVYPHPQCPEQCPGIQQAFKK